ncbi:MAG: hypothetical protein AB7S88_01710 [Candidatus Izemoplasmatales bacterium]
MFQKEQMGVFDWILYFILLAIPVVGLIIFIVVLFSSETNQSLKNFQWAQVVMVIFVVVLMLTVFAPIFNELIDMINNGNFPMP